MKYDFDKTVERRGTGSYKWDALQMEFGVSDVLPMWVADMDFETPPFIIEALKDRLEHPVLGYSLDGADYWPLIIDWWQKHHGWSPEREWMRFVPGVVKGIGLAVNRLTSPGDRIIIQQPVYHPFAHIIEGAGREVVVNHLREREDGLYDMDLEELEEQCNYCKMLILCNPHNPGGVAWNKDALAEVARVCKEKGVVVISDEIHSDLVLWGQKHIPFASVSDEAREISVTFSAPSKTFNIAGVVSSFVIVPNEQLRNRLYSWMDSCELSETHLFAVVATKAAYRNGEEWYRQLLEYLEGNIEYVVDFCNRNIPQIRAVRPEASYLIWLDCRGMNMGHEELNDFFLHKAKLALNDGEMFGLGGEGHMRMNIACPRSRVEQAMKQLQEAISES